MVQKGTVACLMGSGERVEESQMQAAFSGQETGEEAGQGEPVGAMSLEDGGPEA